MKAKQEGISSTKKIKEKERKIEKYKEKIKREISRNGYIYGTIRELSECLKIPLSTLYKIMKSEEFKTEKIKNAKNHYYFLTDQKSKPGPPRKNFKQKTKS